MVGGTLESCNARAQTPKPTGPAAPVTMITQQQTPVPANHQTLQPEAEQTNQSPPTPNGMLSRPPRWEEQQQQQEPIDSRPTSAESNDANAMPAVLAYPPEAVQAVFDEHRTTLVKNARLSEPLDNGWNLFPHQKKAIIKSLLMRRMILALDMGLGKTLIGCVWARAFQNSFEDLQVICICPVSLTQEWIRTAKEATSLSVEEKETKSRGGKNKRKGKTETKAMAYDAERSPREHLPMKIRSWGKVPEAIDQEAARYVVICDEAHSMQSMTTARTKAILKLVQPKRCVVL